MEYTRVKLGIVILILWDGVVHCISSTVKIDAKLLFMYNICHKGFVSDVISILHIY